MTTIHAAAPARLDSSQNGPDVIDEMPHRILNLSFNAVVGLIGLGGAFVGFATDVVHTYGSPLYAFQDPAAGVEVGTSTGGMIALGSAAVTIAAMGLKALSDWWIDLRKRRLEIDRTEMLMRLEIEQRAADARTEAEAEARKEVLDELKQMARDVGNARAELEVARKEAAAAHDEAVATRERLEHANANVKQLEANNTKLLLQIEESTRQAATSAKAAQVSAGKVEVAVTGSLSGDDIPTDPSKLPS